MAVQNIATTVAGLSIAFMTNWKLALTVVVVVPLMLSEGFFRMKLSKEGTDKVYIYTYAYAFSPIHALLLSFLQGKDGVRVVCQADDI